MAKKTLDLSVSSTIDELKSLEVASSRFNIWE